jgi:hypothetical protein
MRMAFGRLLSHHDSHGFDSIGLGDEESGKMKRKLLWVEDMRRYFGKIYNLRVGTQTKYRKNGYVQ